MSDQQLTLVLTDGDHDSVEFAHIAGQDYVSVTMAGANDVHLDRASVNELTNFLNANKHRLKED